MACAALLDLLDLLLRAASLSSRALAAKLRLATVMCGIFAPTGTWFLPKARSTPTSKRVVMFLIDRTSYQ